MSEPGRIELTILHCLILHYCLTRHTSRYRGEDCTSHKKAPIRAGAWPPLITDILYLNFIGACTVALMLMLLSIAP